MRLLVLADIHGNLPALEAVLAEAASFEVDGIISAGDMVTGPQGNEVLGRLEESRASMILGNNEEYMLAYANGTVPEVWWTARQYGFVRHSFRLLNSQSLKILRSLPEQRRVELNGCSPLRVVHGSPRSSHELLFPDRDPAALEGALASISERVMICGHTHLPWIMEQDGKMAINPGAVSGGLNGDIGAQYALLTWDGGRWRAELRTTGYSFELIERAYQDSGLLAEGGVFARGCLASYCSGRNYVVAFLEFAYAYARQAGWQGESLPDDLLGEAEEKFDWSDSGYL